MIEIIQFILLVLFVCKCSWNFLYPAFWAWQYRLWLKGKVGEEPCVSFSMALELDLLLLIVLSLACGYGRGSFPYGFFVIFMGLLGIITSYGLCILITRFIRNLKWTEGNFQADSRYIDCRNSMFMDLLTFAYSGSNRVFQIATLCYSIAKSSEWKLPYFRPEIAVNRKTQ